MMGAPAYSFMIYLRILWNFTKRVNALQAKILNKIVGKRWGKEAPRSKRITNPFLYIGNLIFYIIAPVLNLSMEGVDSLTPETSREAEAAVFRIAARKSDFSSVAPGKMC